MTVQCFSDDPESCVWVPAGGETRYDENGNPILADGGDRAQGLKFKQFCFTEDPEDCVWAPAGGETRYDENGNPILGSGTTTPLQYDRVCFDPNKPDDCVWVP